MKIITDFITKAKETSDSEMYAEIQAQFIAAMPSDFASFNEYLQKDATGTSGLEQLVTFVQRKIKSDESQAEGWRNFLLTIEEKTQMIFSSFFKTPIISATLEEEQKIVTEGSIDIEASAPPALSELPEKQDSIIGDFINNNTQTLSSDLHDSQELFLEEMPKKLSEIEVFFKKDTQDMCDFERLIQHINKQMSSDKKKLNPWKKFLSDIRKNVLSIFYYSMSSKNYTQENFAKGLDVILSMYAMSNTIGTEFITDELNSTALKEDLLKTLMEKVEKFEFQDRERYASLIWRNCILPAQNQAKEGEVVLLVSKFISAAENPIRLLTLYVTEPSFVTVLSNNLPLNFNKNQSETYFQFYVLSALTQLFLSNNMTNKIFDEFIIISQQRDINDIHRHIIKTCFKHTCDQSTPLILARTYATLLIANPTVFFDSLSDLLKTNSRAQYALASIIQATLNFRSEFWKNLFFYCNAVITYKNSDKLLDYFTGFYIPTGKQKLDQRKYCLDLLGKHLENQLSKGENISENFQQLIKAVSQWTTINSDPNFLKAVEGLFNSVINCYFEKNNKDKEVLHHFILSFYNDAPLFIRKAAVNFFLQFESEEIIKAEKISTFIGEALSTNFEGEISANENSGDRFTQNFNETYEKKIWIIQKLQENNLEENNKFIDYLVKQMLDKAILDCDTVLSNPEGLNPDLEKLFEPNFFNRYIFVTGKIKVISYEIINVYYINLHQNILIYLNQRYPAHFEKYIEVLLSKSEINNCYFKDVNQHRLTVFEINPEKFVACLQDSNLRIGTLGRQYVLQDLVTNISENKTDFKKWMQYIKTVEPLCLQTMSAEKIVHDIMATHIVGNIVPLEHLSQFIRANVWMLSINTKYIIYLKKLAKLNKLRSFSFSGLIAEGYLRILSIDAVVSTVLMPLYTARKIKQKEIIDILLVIFDKYSKEEILKSDELCQFIILGLCQLTDKLTLDEQTLIEDCSNLRNVNKNITKFDQYLAYARYSCYPLAENTAIAKVMNYKRGINLLTSISTAGQNFSKMIKQGIITSSSQPTLFNFDTVIDDNAVNDLWTEKFNSKDNAGSSSTKAFYRQEAVDDDEEERIQQKIASANGNNNRIVSDEDEKQDLASPYSLDTDSPDINGNRILSEAEVDALSRSSSSNHSHSQFFNSIAVATAIAVDDNDNTTDDSEVPIVIAEVITVRPKTP